VMGGNFPNASSPTCYVERQSLTMRISMGRFTRLTNGCSKELQNHEYMLGNLFCVQHFRRCSGG
jgi:hypothetical protein